MERSFKTITIVSLGIKLEGFGNSLIGSIVRKIKVNKLKKSPEAITLPNTPAPSSKILEGFYYPSIKTVIDKILVIVK